MTEQKQTTKPRKEWRWKKDLSPEAFCRKKTVDAGLFQNSTLVLMVYLQPYRNTWG